MHRTITRRRTVFQLVVIVLAAGMLGAAQCQPPTPDCTVSGMTLKQNIRYSTSPDVAAKYQSLDVYVPNRPAECTTTLPTVVWVHGGGFVTGDKTNNILDKARLFTGEGWVFASVNYRLVGATGVGPTQGKYPAAEQDVAAAVGYLVAHSSEHEINAGKVMFLGHSAGAFLVSLVSTDATFLQGAGLSLASVRCTASLDTTYDIAHEIAGGGQAELMFRNAFGDDPAVWAQASPPNQVAPGKSIPKFRIVTRGQTDRVAQSQAFATTLQNAGVHAELQRAVGMTHEDVNDAVGAPGDTVITPPLMDFYRACLAPAP